MKRFPAILTLLALCLAPRVASASAGDGPWVHIQIVESGTEGAKVQVHLPLSLVRLGLEMAPGDVIVDGKLRLRHSEVTAPELRRMWRELRAAGDAEFVTVEKEDETVRVSRRGEHFLVQVDDRGGAEPEQVRIRIPLAVVDALLAGEGDRLDVAGALVKLQAFRGEVLEVQDGETHVRMWIDETAAPRP
ncbi:MAG: hypothetical protein ABR599_05340 [Gemmatimonadota bacterium]